MSGISAPIKRIAQERIVVTVTPEFLITPEIVFAYSPTEFDSEIVCVNGLIQTPSAYSFSSNALTFNQENGFKIGDTIFIKYWRAE